MTADLRPTAAASAPDVADPALSALVDDDMTPTPWWRAWLPPVALLVVLVLALAVVHRELGASSAAHVMAALRATPSAALAQAAVYTVLAYVLLCGYDLLALRHVGSTIGVGRTALASALAYALSQTLGFPLVTGGAVRVRFWSMWGLSGTDIARATAFVGATFLVGVAAVCGLALLLEPTAMLGMLHLAPIAARALGVLLLGVVVAWIVLSMVRRDVPLNIAGYAIALPTPTLAVAQVLLALLDWGVAGLVLYVLLPAGHGVTLLSFLGVFVLAQFAGVASHVPGGLGVFESLLLIALRGAAPPTELLGALLAYRAIYYLAPFALGLVTLAALEVSQHRARLPVLFGTVTAAATDAAGSVLGVSARIAVLLQPLLPAALSISTFIGGTLLLFSGATPAAHGRLRALTAVLPLGIVETSHFIGSLAGVGLLVLAAALRRRLDAAWAASIALLTVGIAASLLKGLDWEEASVLGVLLAVLLASRRAFYRPTTLTGEILSPAWLLATVAVVGASVWLGVLSYRHIEYRTELWWHFAARGNAPRFLRASAGAIVALFGAGLWRLFRPAHHDPELPDAATLDRAADVIARVPESTPALALLGDKALMFADDGAAFVMYGVAGRSWISMGDPIGPGDRLAEVAWRFSEAADAHGAWPVFYQVTPARLPLYIDLGLSLLKLGEEAVVPLDGFTMDGGARKWMRRALKDGEKAGMQFEVVPPSAVPALLPTLRAISDEWLGGKTTREKGFSLGRFDDAYLQRFPLALVHATHADGGTRLVAFANVWMGCPGGEISPDLMRRTTDAPRGVMDFLFVHLLQWGAEYGYRAANLGMTPLAGLIDPTLARPELAPLWARAGTFLYGRGEALYNFRGVRGFKEKFAPVWEPRYLAAPGGTVLPRALTHVATLIAGGVGGLVHK